MGIAFAPPILHAALVRVGGTSRRQTQSAIVVWTCKQKAPENRGAVCWGVGVRPRPVRDNHGGISSEMIVDANLDRAEFGGAGIEGESTQGISLAVEVREHVLGLGGPVRREHVFDAATDGVSGMDMAVRSGQALSGKGRLVINPGIAALGVEQRRIRSDTDTAGNASKRVDLVLR